MGVPVKGERSIITIMTGASLSKYENPEFLVKGTATKLVSYGERWTIDNEQKR